MLGFSQRFIILHDKRVHRSSSSLAWHQFVLQDADINKYVLMVKTQPYDQRVISNNQVDPTAKHKNLLYRTPTGGATDRLLPWEQESAACRQLLSPDMCDVRIIVHKSEGRFF